MKSISAIGVCVNVKIMWRKVKIAAHKINYSFGIVFGSYSHYMCCV
jgi:hypothetical protein